MLRPDPELTFQKYKSGYDFKKNTYPDLTITPKSRWLLIWIWIGNPAWYARTVLCRIVPSGSVPHRYRTNLTFVCGSLRYDVVYNLDEDPKNVFKNNVVCMILIRNVIILLRIFILLGPHRQNLSLSGTESVGPYLFISLPYLHFTYYDLTQLNVLLH